MITHSRKNDFGAKQEGDTNDSKISQITSTSRQWAANKNPRIVRVSRSFGGKDRHSKVCTIRGLRDRRIRLSVPTAIQLYDLQDRLGLSQPSKVVDWLLDATQHEIDKLPPLQMPQVDFTQFGRSTLIPQESNAPQSSLSPFFNSNAAYMKEVGTQTLLSSKEGIDVNDEAIRGKSKYWDFDAAFRAKSKEVEGENQNQGGNGGYMDFFLVANQPSYPQLLNNAMPYNNYHWEPSNLSLSQFGSQGFSSQTDPHNNHSLSLPSSLALPSASPLFFCPSTTTPSLFTPYSIESDPRQSNHFQILSSNSQHIVPNPLMSPLHLLGSPVKSFPPNINPKIHSQNSEDSQPNKGSSGS